MNEGHRHARLGLKGIPDAAEEIMAPATSCWPAHRRPRPSLPHEHPRSVELIRGAKARGVRVTAEVCPHHFSLTDEAVRGVRHQRQDEPAAARGGRSRRGPRGARRRHARRASPPTTRRTTTTRRSGSSTTRPTASSGWRRRCRSAFTELVPSGLIDLPTMVERMSCAPARLCRSTAGTCGRCAMADGVVFDPQARVDGGPGAFRSKSRNTPWGGEALPAWCAPWWAGGACSADWQLRAAPGGYPLTRSTGKLRASTASGLP